MFCLTSQIWSSGYHSHFPPRHQALSRQVNKHLAHSPHAQNHPIVQFEKEINPRYTIGAPEKGIDMTPEDSCFRAFEMVSNGRAGGIINQLEIAGTGHANATVTTVNSTSDQQSLQNDARKKGFRLGPARSVRLKPKSPWPPRMYCRRDRMFDRVQQQWYQCVRTLAVVVFKITSNAQTKTTILSVLWVHKLLDIPRPPFAPI